MSARPEAPLLPRADWLQVVRHAPLVSIDLILRDAQGRVLLGLRENEPARGLWFVPGGVIRKDETLDAAFSRIARNELGVPWSAARRGCWASMSITTPVSYTHLTLPTKA